MRIRESRPRLLFLCQTLPFPPNIGVAIRTYNVLRLLAMRFDVTALCFYRKAVHESERAVEQSVEALSALADTRAFPIPQEFSRARFLLDHARSATGFRPYTVYAYESRAFRSTLIQVLKDRTFDVAHVDSLDLSAYLELLSPLPTICVHHNVESALLRRRGLTTSGLRGAYLSLQAILTEQEEKRSCGRVDLNVVVSDPDAVTLRRIVPDANIAVVPNGVDTVAFQPGTGEVRQEVVFVGGASWQPNREAMIHFCERILPEIRARGVLPAVTWVGQVPDDLRRQLAARYGVTVTGYVDDIRPLVQAAACYVVPLLAGGGTRLKILDAWAMGKATVSTSMGCEGLAARDGENILIRDDAATFADAVIAVLGDARLRERLEIGARQTAQSLYDWTIIGRHMLPLYERYLR